VFRFSSNSGVVCERKLQVGNSRDVPTMAFRTVSNTRLCRRCCACSMPWRRKAVNWCNWNARLRVDSESLRWHSALDDDSQKRDVSIPLLVSPVCLTWAVSRIPQVLAPQDGHRSEHANGEFQYGDFLPVLTKAINSDMRLLTAVRLWPS
jgi:hypothetical protein